MDEVKTKTIEIQVNQEKIDYINYAYNKEMTYWKKAALDRVSTENEKKELMDLAPSKVSLICKAKSTKTKNIDEIIFYLKSKYSAYNVEPRTLLKDIPGKELSFKEITNYLKTFSESIKKDEDMSLKNKYLFGGWILMASKVYRRNNSTYSFKDWL